MPATPEVWAPILVQTVLKELANALLWVSTVRVAHCYSGLDVSSWWTTGHLSETMSSHICDSHVVSMGLDEAVGQWTQV